MSITLLNAFYSGGQWNWKNSTTLPNILKMFNPNVSCLKNLKMFDINELITFSWFQKNTAIKNNIFELSFEYKC